MELRRELRSEGNMLVFVSDRDEDKIAQETGAAAGESDGGQKASSAPAAAVVSGPVITREAVGNRVRLATVDNFQGEEADVVIVSTVRCNDACKKGFLASPNRINVLLSRARHGMIILGSARTLTGGRTGDRAGLMWASVLQKLRAEVGLSCL